MPMPTDRFGRPLQLLRPIAAQSVTTSGTTAKTASALNEKTIAVELRAVTEACYVNIGGSSVTAAATNFYLHSGETVIYPVRPGVDTHVAAIQSAAGGFLKITELEG